MTEHRAQFVIRLQREEDAGERERGHAHRTCRNDHPGDNQPREEPDGQDTFA